MPELDPGGGCTSALQRITHLCDKSSISDITKADWPLITINSIRMVD